MADMDSPWKRFWRLRDERYALDESGFLADPEEFLRGSQASSVQPLEHWADAPCLVLLGEQGIGKTRALREWCGRPLTHTQAPPFRIVEFDLAEAGFQNNFRERVLDAVWFTEWRQGIDTLELACDSLDEAPDGPTPTGKHLLRRLRELPLDRLRLRIACRTALWPERLTEELATLSPLRPVVLELLPLRRRDVWAAAEAHRVDPDAFVQAVIAHNAQALASQPLTLDMLLTQFARGRFPRTRAELYQQGLQKLCEETPERRTGQARPCLSAAQRLAVAERIAACTLLSGYSAVSVGDVATSEHGLHESTVLGGHEGSDASRVEMGSPSIVRETLNTGLFNGLGPERFGFRHHSYAEFLAACFIARHRLAAAQIEGLITCGDDVTGHRVVPRLAGLATWLVSLMPEFAQRILRSQPDLALGADMRCATLAGGALAHAFLATVEEGRARRPRGHSGFLYGGFRSPDLAEHLRPWLTRTHSLEARRAAVSVVDGCGCNALAHELVGLALDVRENHELRADAALAVCQLDDADGKALLRPLAFGDSGDDPDDELRGAALLACWPNHMSLDELLSCIASPSNRQSIGLYSAFLHSDATVREIAATDLPRVLSWCAEQVGWHDNTRLDTFADAVLRRAVCSVEQADVMDAIIDLWLRRLSRSVPLFERYVHGGSERTPDPLSNADTRRALVLRLVDRLDETAAAHLSWQRVDILRPEDFDWLSKEIARTHGVHLKPLLNMTSQLFDPSNHVHRDILEQISQERSDLAQWCRSRLSSPTPIQESDEQRTHSAVDKIRALLAAGPHGAGAWLSLMRAISRTSAANLGAPEVWNQLAEDEQHAVLNEATAFLEHTTLDPATPVWLSAGDPSKRKHGRRVKPFR